MATILVVDDDPGTRDFLATLLKFQAHEVLEAGDGLAALEVLRSAGSTTPIDLIIADVLMPVLDGYGLVQRVRESPALASIPVIFFSGSYSEHEAHTLAQACGVQHMLHKPALPDDILNAVARSLAPSAHAPPALAPETFSREHLRLVTDHLAHEVTKLEVVNSKLAALLELSQRFALEREPRRLLEQFCQASRTLLGARHSAIGILDHEGQSLQYFLTSGEDNGDSGSLEPQEFLGHFIETRRPRRSNHSAGDSGEPHALLSAPIASPSRVYGWLCLTDKFDGTHFSDEDEQLASILAGNLGRVYENDVLFVDLLRQAANLEQEINERRSAEEALSRRSRQLESLARAGLQVNAVLETDQVLRELVESACELVQTEGGMAGRFLRGRMVFEEYHDRGAWQTFRAPFAPSAGVFGWVIENRRPALAHTASEGADELTKELADRPLQNVINVPILGRTGELLGCFAMFNKSRNEAFDESDLTMLGSLAAVTAVALENADILAEQKRTEQQLRLYTQRVEALRDLDHAILQARSSEEIAQAALVHLRRLLPIASATVLVFDKQMQEAVVLAAYPECAFQAGRRLPLGTTRAGMSNALPNLESLLAAPGKGLPQDTLLLPLQSQGEAIGALRLGSPPGSFPPEAEDIAGDVADSVAVAIRQAWLFEQVRAGREHLQRLSSQLVQAQETERRRIARELHDEIGQMLTALRLNLQALHRSKSPSTSPHLEESLTMVDRTLQQVRNLSLDLRPSMLDDLGLQPALRWYLDRLAQRAGLSAHFVAEPFSTPVSPDVETACFRVAQEVLTNTVRHARARVARVELHQRESELEMKITDDGVGFDVRAALERAARGESLGLLGLRERVTLLGGRMDIVSVLGQGTEIRATFPLSSLPG